MAAAWAGCAILYCLARLGSNDVVLLERGADERVHVHSLGLVGQLRSSLSLTKMMMESVDHYLNYACTEQALFDKVVTWERVRYCECG